MLDLTVYIKYERKKARLLLDMRQEEVALTIRRDFTSMKLPHPPRSNIKKPTLKGVTASWTTWKNSNLYRIVTAVIHDQDSDPRMKRAKLDHDIQYLILREKPHTLNSSLRSESDTSRRGRQRSRSPPLRQSTLGSKRAVENIESELDTSRRGRQRSRSPPLRQSTLSSKRAVENIDGVIQNLLKINDSLNTQILPESDVSLPQDVADISAYPHQAHKRPVSLPYSEDERRLRNELAKIQEELTAAVLRAAEIERELPVEATNVSVSPDSSQLAELGIPAQLTKTITERILERRKREEVEWVLADVKRECRHPTVVPALLKVMDAIALGATQP